MDDEGDQLEGELPLEGAGQRLSRAREEAGKTVEQIASETRIPIRHLETLESGDFAALPAKTYAIGFARTYARSVGLDEKEIAAQVRDELSDGEDAVPHRGTTFEPSDPARIPSRRLAWFSAFAVLILVVGTLVMMLSGKDIAQVAESFVATHGYVDPETNSLSQILIYLIMFLPLFFMGAGRYFSIDWMLYHKLQLRLARIKASKATLVNDPFAVNATTRPS